jgi:hypothetical protein
MGIMIYSILSIKKDTGKLNTLLEGMKGVMNEKLFTVASDQIIAVVSHTTSAGLIPDRPNAIKYAGVIEILAQQFTLCPMRFGSVMETTDAIGKMLERNKEEIQKNLQHVENKVEYGLKIFCNSEKLCAELKSKPEAVIQLNEKPGSEFKNSIYKEYVNKKLKEHRLEELLLAYVDSVVAQITLKIDRLNAEIKFRKIVKETTIIDAVFLLRKEQEKNLIGIIDDFKNQFPSLNFVLTGPWPPYNFVEITIK